MMMESIEPLHTAKRASRLVEITAPHAFQEFMTAGKHPATPRFGRYILSPSNLYLVALVSQWHRRKAKIHIHIKISSGTTVGNFQAPSLPSADALLSLFSILCIADFTQ